VEIGQIRRPRGDPPVMFALRAGRGGTAPIT
jgi:hypothetical protein